MLSKRRDWRYYAADVVSLLTNPVIISVASIFAIVYRFAPSTEHFWHWSLAAAFLLLGPSGAYAIRTWYEEKRIDLDVTKRQDRMIPLILATTGAIIGSFFVLNDLHNHTLTLISYVLVAMLISLTIVTFVWKISLHAATTASMVTMLVSLVSPYFAFLFLLLLPIIWSRLHLHRHTLAQLLVGSLTGVVITLVSVLLFRR